MWSSCDSTLFWTINSHSIINFRWRLAIPSTVITLSCRERRHAIITKCTEGWLGSPEGALGSPAF